MQVIKKMMVAFCCLFLACNVLAAKKRDLQCPSKEMVAAAVFTKAIAPDPNNEEDIGWGFLTDNFKYENLDWNIAFALGSLDPKMDPADALAKGQDAFTNHVQLEEPIMIGEEGDEDIMCLYAMNDNYAVFAATPPVSEDDTDGSDQGDNS